MLQGLFSASDVSGREGEGVKLGVAGGEEARGGIPVSNAYSWGHIGGIMVG